jgi:hypothetical protein
VVIEIKCSQQGSECGFLSFDSHPLVLTDNRGRYYPMLDGGTRPEGVSANRAPFDDQWRFQAGRVLKLEVSFASLLTGTANVKLQYRDNNQATPANFSLVRNK